MRIVRRQGWEIPEARITPEAAVVGRRSALATGAAALALSISGARIARAAADPAAGPAPDAPGGSGPMNAAFTPGRALTPERDVLTYNNYYEFSEGKNLWQSAQRFPLRPFSVTIDGMVAQKRTMSVDDLIRAMPIEERIYRHRCVERWAMTVPWTGFPLAALVKMAQPLGSAKYIRFETIQDDKHMPGLSDTLYPWPYIEAVTMEEAMNPLAFMSTGLFGRPLTAQNGGPVRLTLPWKYGFKSGKAVMKISFVEKRPNTFWAEINPDEYGFWANVNPAVPHPRWSQAQERLIGTDDIVPTQIYNGYGAQVASLYANMPEEKLFR
jgi:sulfoxide reductase catalytic subunit YedY